MESKVPDATPDKEPGAWRKRIMLAVDVALFAVALVVLHKVLTSYRLEDVAKSFRDIGLEHITLSLALTAVGYASLVGYDYASVLVVGRTVSIRRLWAPSFISHAVQNSAPMAIVAGSGVRYKLFSRLGLSPADIGAMVAANTVTFVLGLLAVAGLSFILGPIPVPASLHLPIHDLQPIGALFLVVVVALVLAAVFRRKPIQLGKRRIDLLGGRHLALQLAVSTADWLLSAAALYVLYAASGPVPYIPFLSGFLLAQIITQIVPLPGGIGVFEAAMLVVRPAGISAPEVTAALVLYRVNYYLIPLLAATALLAHRSSDQESTGPLAPVWEFVRKLTPQVLAVLTFLSGLILLSFGAVPADAASAGWLQRAMPVVVVEGSHLMASFVGIALLILAWGLARGVHGAFRITIGLLLLGIPLVLIRSTDLISAIMLLLMLLLLITGRKEFPRRTPLTAEPLDAGWVVATILAVGGVIWLGIFARMHREYAGTSWWQLTFDKDAPADLRFAVLALTVGIAYVGLRMVARARRVRRSR
jgi:phosphatidylglycerol lysyltransferase